MPPGRVFRCQAQHQLADLLVDRRPARPRTWIRPPPGDQLPVPSQQRGRGDEERRPPRTRQQPRQRRQHHPISRLQIGAVHLTPQHRHLVAQHQQLDVLRPTVPGKLGQHSQDLAQQQVHQRSGHSLGSSQLPQRRPRTEPHLKQPNLIYEPHRLGLGSRNHARFRRLLRQLGNKCCQGARRYRHQCAQRGQR